MNLRKIDVPASGGEQERATRCRKRKPAPTCDQQGTLGKGAIGR